MAKRSALKATKNCVVCNEPFLGTEGKQTCSSRCRTKLARLKAAKKKPEYLLIAKSKGQKIPDLNAPKRLYFKKGEKKHKPGKVVEAKINFATPTPESYDGEKLNPVTIDEIALVEPPKKLTQEQIWKHNADINEKIRIEKAKTGEPGVHPRMFKLQQTDRISELQKQLI